MVRYGAGKVYLVGGGIGALAAAAFLVRDAGVPGTDITILEQLPVVGGSMDGAKAPTAEGGYVTRGGRMFEEEHYVCLWNLLESIPTLDDPSVSVRQEFLAFNIEHPTRSRARVIRGDRSIADAADLGFDTRSRADLMRLLAMPERLIGSRRIDEFFQPPFFETNFWCMWRTTFAFQTWHSAIELRRYFLAFVQEFDRIHTLSGVRRSKYNQYDSVILPIHRWLERAGVRTEYGTTVTDVRFADASCRRMSALEVERAEGTTVIDLDPADRVFLTLGSMTADTAYGDRDTVPELIRDKRDGSWRLWERIAAKAPDFGRPQAFSSSVDESKWESFTLTMHSPALLERITAYTGNVPGSGALMTWKDSSWLLSVVVPAQPHFRDQEPGTYTLWGYGLFGDRPGDYLRKPMDDCTGAEILDELLGHLGFDDIADEVRRTTQITTVQMPYIDAQFMPRAISDRPYVIPKGAQNYAFLGQFTEVPEGVVFTVEYSVRTAMIAVYHHYGVTKPIPPMYHGLADPKVAFTALRTALG
ncbi:oleate hydratase [Actinocorallia sp. A-T 12471]|uniref:oleate hydratase n=1 Tax=Actinocorallia sp. A-T 12471 TaxID=3089813 RepID=UPI0029CEA601|nr:oleate hydratase [Actinocorallia sp. A-T 12471]MDX6742587.1 oleate hydratase [Actinocorallia sp. A-T 12471]